jgi:predicted HTH transcriptional regulator
LLADANVVVEYLKFSINPILDRINSGETATVEFKSSFRWDVQQQKRNDKTIQAAVLKTLVAFLNSDGGILLIGVADDGAILGIEFDGYKNRDEYQRSGVANINNRIGPAFVDALEIEFHQIGSKEIISVRCAADHGCGNAFLDNDEYYIRQGPSSRPLQGKELVDHIELKRQ